MCVLVSTGFDVQIIRFRFHLFGYDDSMGVLLHLQHFDHNLLLRVECIFFAGKYSRRRRRAGLVHSVRSIHVHATELCAALARHKTSFVFVIEHGDGVWCSANSPIRRCW